MAVFFTTMFASNHLLLVLSVVLLLSSISMVSCSTTTKTSSFYAYETQPSPNTNTNTQVHASSHSSTINNNNPTTTFSSSSSSSSSSHSSSSSTTYDQNGQMKQNAHASASKSQNGVTYDYTFDNGIETLTVKGGPIDFDKEAVLSDLRKSVGIKKAGMNDVSINHQPIDQDMINTPTKTQTHSHSFTKSQSTPYQTHTLHVSSTTFEDKEGNYEPSQLDTQFSLLSSVSSFLLGSTLGSNIQSLYDTLMRDENVEQLRLAENELANVEDDLSKITTQEHILRTRQADLGAYIQRAQENPQERNPTLDELVGIEDDRLALLENRLRRMKNKLLSQKTELINFIKVNQQAYFRPSSTDLFKQGETTDLDSEKKEGKQ